MQVIQCANCGAAMHIRDEDADRRLRCPRCGMFREGRGSVTPDRGHNEFTFGTRAAEISPNPDSTPYRGESGDSYRIDEETDQWSMKSPEGEIYGPVPRLELDQWEREGRVSGDCLVQRVGSSHWESALVLYPHLATAARLSGVLRGKQSRHHVGTDWNRPVATGPMRPNSGIVVFIMGVLGIATLFFPVFAAIAWYMGAAERKAIQAGEASPRGSTLVDIGYFLGALGTLVGGTLWVGCCLTGPFVR